MILVNNYDLYFLYLYVIILNCYVKFQSPQLYNDNLSTKIENLQNIQLRFQ